MTPAKETAVGALLASMMRDRGVEIAHLAEHAGLVWNTVKYILTGRIARPKEKTLRALALALATDHFTREVDRQYWKKAEQELLMTAGYMDPSDDVADAALERLYFYRLASREGARARTKLFGVLTELTPAAIESIPRVLAGGPDTEGVGEILRQMGYP
jgi:hypothetical protein